MNSDRLFHTTGFGMSLSITRAIAITLEVA